MNLREIEESLESNLQPVLTPSFVYGLTAGASLFCLFLMRVLGATYCLSNSQVHLNTLMWICLIFGLSYYGYRMISPLKRFIAALASLIFIFYIHDTLWIIGTIHTGVWLEGVLMHSNKEYYASAFSRNFVFLFGSFLVIRKHSSFGKRFFILLGIEAALCACNAFIQGLYFFPVYPFIDTLPLFGVASIPSGRGKGTAPGRRLPV